MSADDKTAHAVADAVMPAMANRFLWAVTTGPNHPDATPEKAVEAIIAPLLDALAVPREVDGLAELLAELRAEVGEMFAWTGTNGKAILRATVLREIDRLSARGGGDDARPLVQHGVGSGWPLVAGNCPACGGASLFLGSGGYVTCSRLDCSDPCAASEALTLSSALSTVEPEGETTPPVESVEIRTWDGTAEGLRSLADWAGNDPTGEPQFSWVTAGAGDWSDPMLGDSALRPGAPLAKVGGWVVPARLLVPASRLTASDPAPEGGERSGEDMAGLRAKVSRALSLARVRSDVNVQHGIHDDYAKQVQAFTAVLQWIDAMPSAPEGERSPGEREARARAKHDANEARARLLRGDGFAPVVEEAGDGEEQA